MLPFNRWSLFFESFDLSFFCDTLGFRCFLVFLTAEGPPDEAAFLCCLVFLTVGDELELPEDELELPEDELLV
jgi:hypothetical protein